MSHTREYAHIIAELVQKLLGIAELDYMAIRSRSCVKDFYETIGQLDDALILRNWLAYAMIIGDKRYLEFTQESVGSLSFPKRPPFIPPEDKIV